MIRIKLIKKPKGTTGRVAAGGGFIVSGGGGSGGYATEAGHARRADRATYAERADIADRAIEADHAASARDLDKDSPVRDEFLSKKKPDRTPYDLTVGGDLHGEKEVRADGGLTVGQFVSGLSGANVDGRGNGEVGSLVVRSFMQIYELIVNRQRTIEGDVMLTEGDTIEEVIPMGVSDEGNERFTLKLHPEWEGYTTAQYEGNVLRGIYNNITQQIPSGDGETTIHNATYFTSWMRVLAVRPGDNEIDVVMYPDVEVPAGRNFAPQPMMKFSRWGNAGGTEEQLKRQTVLYLSSTEGRIMKRYHVTKPICDLRNVAICIGTLPEELGNLHPSLKGVTDGGYFSTLAVQQLVKLDHQGLPEPEITYRGEFDPTAEYYDGTELVESSGKYEWSCVLYYGCQWLCTRKGTHNPPSWDSTDWMLYLGDPTLKLEWDGTEDSVEVENPAITLSVSARIYNQEITADPKIRWDWTRVSIHDGVEDTASDALWNAAHANCGRNSLDLVMADMNYRFGRHPESLTYTVTATLIDKAGEPVREQSMVFSL